MYTYLFERCLPFARATLRVRLAQSFVASLAHTLVLFLSYSLSLVPALSLSLAVTFRCRQLMAKLLVARSLRVFFIQRRLLGRGERVCSDSKKKKKYIVTNSV